MRGVCAIVIVAVAPHLFEARRGSRPLLMVTEGLGGAGGPSMVTEGGPLPGGRPLARPSPPKAGSRGTVTAALLLE